LAEFTLYGEITR